MIKKKYFCVGLQLTVALVSFIFLANWEMSISSVNPADIHFSVTVSSYCDSLHCCWTLPGFWCAVLHVHSSWCRCTNMRTENIKKTPLRIKQWRFLQHCGETRHSWNYEFAFPAEETLLMFLCMFTIWWIKNNSKDFLLSSLCTEQESATVLSSW